MGLNPRLRAHKLGGTSDLLQVPVADQYNATIEKDTWCSFPRPNPNPLVDLLSSDAFVPGLSQSNCERL